MKHRYQITRIAQIGVQEIELLVNDGSGFAAKELGDAGWRVVSTFEGPGKTMHGVGRFLWALWEQTYE
jgi:hypothetical protein